MFFNVKTPPQKGKTKSCSKKNVQLVFLFLFYSFFFRKPFIPPPKKKTWRIFFARPPLQKALKNNLCQVEKKLVILAILWKILKNLHLAQCAFQRLAHCALWLGMVRNLYRVSPNYYFPKKGHFSGTPCIYLIIEAIYTNTN